MSELGIVQILEKDSDKIYKIHFNSVYDLQTYLKGNPPVNSKVFNHQKSISLSEDFAGEKLEKAIDYLSGGYDKNFDKFLLLKKDIDSINIKKNFGRKTINSFVGSRPNVPAYVAGAPKTMKRLEKVGEKKFIDINMNLAYPGTSKDTQIVNRGILVLNLISLLENNNIGVNFRVFEMVNVGHEIFYIDIEMKKPGEILDIRKCYYPMCGKEFLRRITARVKESMPFKNPWERGYGMVMSEMDIRSILNIDNKKILISSPDQMGILGKNLYEDADSFLNKIHLDDNITFPKYGDL